MATAVLGSTYLIGPSSSGGYLGTAPQGGNREDVLDLVINIDPFDTPWVTMAPKTTASHVVHEWVQDTLQATATGAVTGGGAPGAAWPEGADFNAENVSDRTRIQNWTQIFRRDIKVSNTQRAVSPIGLRDEYAYQIMKATREIARNIEATVWRASGGSATGTTAVARLMKVFEDFLTSNSAWARGTKLGNSGTDVTATAHPIFENDFNSMMQVIYEAGGNPDAVFVAGGSKRYISKYGGNMGVTGANAAPELRRVIDATERRIVRAVNIYESDFGPIQVVLDRWIPQSTNTGASGTDTRGRMFFLERSRNRLAFLRPIRHVPLPPAGDNTRGMIVGELTLEVLAEKGSGLIKAVNNRDQ